MVDLGRSGRPASVTGRLARYGLVDIERARMMLGPAQLRLWDEAGQRPADEGAAAVLEALSRAADPDLALLQLCRINEAEGHAEPTAPGEARLLASLRSNASLRARLLAVLGASDTL